VAGFEVTGDNQGVVQAAVQCVVPGAEVKHDPARTIIVRADVIATSVTVTNLQGHVYNSITLDHTNS
jgi:hypothetical protein